MGLEHIVKLIPALFHGLGSRLDIWVSRRFKLLLDLIKLKGSVLVSIKLFVGFLHKLESCIIEITYQ